MRTALPYNTVYCIPVADLELLWVEYRSKETRSSLQHFVLLL
jgi:hypothetical protein